MTNRSLSGAPAAQEQGWGPIEELSVTATLTNVPVRKAVHSQLSSIPISTSLGFLP